MTCVTCKHSAWNAYLQRGVCELMKQGYPHIGIECPDYERYSGAENDYLEQPETD